MKHAYTLIPFLVVVRIIEVFSLTAELWQEEYLPLYPETQKTPESHNKFEKVGFGEKDSCGSQVVFYRSC